MDDHRLSGVPQSRALRPERVAQRRTRELHALASQGMPVVFHNKWKVSIGPLYIWPQSGRWWNETTGRAGKINSLSMRALIENYAT